MEGVTEVVEIVGRISFGLVVGGGIFLFAATIEHWRNRYLARPGPPSEVERWQMLVEVSERIVPWERRVGLFLLRVGAAGLAIYGMGMLVSLLV